MTHPGIFYLMLWYTTSTINVTLIWTACCSVDKTQVILITWMRSCSRQFSIRGFQVNAANYIPCPDVILTWTHHPDMVFWRWWLPIIVLRWCTLGIPKRSAHAASSGICGASANSNGTWRRNADRHKKEAYPWSIASDVIVVLGVTRVDQHWLSLLHASKAWGSINSWRHSSTGTCRSAQQEMKWRSLNFDTEFKGAYVRVRVGNVLSPQLGIGSLEFFQSKDRAGAAIPSGRWSLLIFLKSTSYKLMKGEDIYCHG